jgi:hypothetical protein
MRRQDRLCSTGFKKELTRIRVDSAPLVFAGFGAAVLSQRGGQKAAEILLSCPLYAQAKAAENDRRGGSSG